MINLQKKVLQVRLVAYLSITIGSFIIPLLIYKATNNPLIVGLSLFIEWIPKIFTYLFGGYLLNSINAIKFTKIYNLIKIFLFGSLLLNYHTINNVYLIAITAGMFQILNALYNIQHETFLYHCWKKEHSTNGFMLSSRGDVLSALINIPLFMFLSVGQLIIVGALFCLISMIISNHASYKEVCLQVSNDNIFIKINDILPHLASTFKLITKNKELMDYMFMSLTIRLPMIILYPTLPYILEAFHVGDVKNMFTNINNIKSLFIVLFLTAMPYMAVKKWISKNHLFLFSILLNSVGLIILLISQTLMLFAIGFIVISISSYPYVAWYRDQRKLEDTNNDEKMVASGLLISIEALSFILGSMIIACVGKNYLYGLYFCAILMTISLMINYKHGRKMYLNNHSNGVKS